MAPAMCSNYFDSYNLMSPPLSPSHHIKTEMDFKTEIDFKTELDFKSELDFQTEMDTKLDFKTELDFNSEMEHLSILPDNYDSTANFPDISDFDLSQITDNLDMDLMEKMMMEAVNSPLIENLDDHEPIKQDCMWGSNSPRGRNQNKRKNSFTLPDMMEAKRIMTDPEATSSFQLSTSPSFPSSFLCSAFPQDINYLENPFYTQELPEATETLQPQLSDSDSDEVDVESSSSEDEDMLNEINDRLDHQTVIVVKKNNSAITQVVVEEHSDHCYTSPINTPYLTPPQSSASSSEDEEGAYIGEPPKHKYQYVISRDTTSKRKKTREEMSLIKKSQDKTVQLRIRETVGGRKSASKQKLDAAQSERQRRVEIANSFELVRTSVPTIAGSEKVSKLVILNAATDYIHQQNDQHLQLRKQKTKLASKNAELKKKLRMLQLQVAQAVRI